MKFKLLFFICFFILMPSLNAQKYREIKKGDFVGLQGSLGNVVVPIIYDQIIYDLGDAMSVAYTKGIPFREDNVVAAVQKDYKWGLVSSSNKIVEPLIYESFMHGYGYYFLDKENKVSLFDFQGNKIIPPQYLSIMLNSETKNNNYVLKPEFAFSGFSSRDFWIRQKVDDKKWYIYYPKSNTFDAQTYDSYVYDFGEDLLYLEKDSLFTLVDYKFKTVIPYKYSYLKPSLNNTIIACLNKKWGLININEEVLVPFIYDDMMLLSEKSIALKKGSDWVVMDLNNRKLSTNKFDEIIKILPDQTWMYYFVCKNNKYGIIDDYGNIIKAIEYDTMRKNKYIDIEVQKKTKNGVHIR